MKQQTEENPQPIKAETKKPAFPMEAEITKYGFLYFGKEALAILGWQRGDKVTLQQTPDGLLIAKATQKKE